MQEWQLIYGGTGRAHITGIFELYQISIHPISAASIALNEHSRRVVCGSKELNIHILQEAGTQVWAAILCTILPEP